MDADLNWLDDELSALNEAEGAMGQISFESAFPVIRDNDNTTESGNGKVSTCIFFRGKLITCYKRSGMLVYD